MKTVHLHPSCVNINQCKRNSTVTGKYYPKIGRYISANDVTYSAIFDLLYQETGKYCLYGQLSDQLLNHETMLQTTLYNGTY